MGNESSTEFNRYSIWQTLQSWQTMHTWHWQTWDGVDYLTCSLLEPWTHGFFTRQSWPLKPDELVSAMHPEAHVYRIKQVHGNQVLSSAAVRAHQEQLQRQDPAPAEKSASRPFPEADGLYSDGHNQTVWVCTADCTPVLIADTQTGQVAAVHAGWRGTAAKIVPTAIAHFQDQGSRIERPTGGHGTLAISGEVYQVTTEVAAQVGASVVDSETLAESQSAADPDTIPNSLMRSPNAPMFADEKPGHVRLDVRQVNALQLEQLGLQPEQVAIAPHCTYQQPEQFFSYRRDGLKQVQWSGIMSAANSDKKVSR